MENDFLALLIVFFYSLIVTILLDMKITLKSILTYSLFILLILFLLIYINSYYNYITLNIFHPTDIDDENLKKLQVYGLKGDYIGGVFGTLFSIFTVILSAIAIYYAVKNNNSQIATQLKIETLNKENLVAQHKPFLNIDLKLDGCTFSVSLTNMGLGPLAFKNFHLKKQDLCYGFYQHLNSVNLSTSIAYRIDFEINSDTKLVLGSGIKKKIWKIKIEKVGHNNELNNEITKYLKDLSTYKFVYQYTDIFDKLYKEEKDFEWMVETYKLQ